MAKIQANFSEPLVLLELIIMKIGTIHTSAIPANSNKMNESETDIYVFNRFKTLTAMLG